MKPQFSLEKIKFRVDPSTFTKAVALYESGKVINFKEDFDGFSANVLGTQKYKVFVDSKYFDQGICSCYLGQREILCKHMVTVALFALLKGRKLNKENKEPIGEVKCSNQAGILSKEELIQVKKEIAEGLRCIKPYNGPSRLWFSYQDSLFEGCNRLGLVVSSLPVSKQTSDLLVDLLLKLDKKLNQGGVDDSDGTVGGFIEATVKILKDFAIIDKDCIKSFEKLRYRETCFGWEKSLIDGD